jgi:hypothetical protein
VKLSQLARMGARRSWRSSRAMLQERKFFSHKQTGFEKKEADKGVSEPSCCA